MRKTVWFNNEQFLIEHSDKIKGRVLDVGCGHMKYKETLEQSDVMKEYVGVDFYESEGVQVVADLNKKLPLEDNQFDAAICISVLEHVLEPQLVLDEIYRVLKPGSYLLFSTPWTFPYHGVPGDHFRFSRKALNYMLEKAGFTVVENLPTGGKLRISIIFMVFWFPFLKKFQRYLDLFISKVEKRSVIQKASDGDSPSHHVVAQK